MVRIARHGRGRAVASALLATAISILLTLTFAAPVMAAGAAALGLVAESGEGSSNSTVVIPPNLTPLEREALLARLSDEQVRMLVQGLLADAQTAGGQGVEQSLLETVESEAAEIRGNFALLIAAAPKLLGIVPFWIGELIPDDGGFGTLIVIALFFTAVLAVGYGAEWLVRKAMANTAEQLRQRSPETFTARLAVAFLRLGLDVLNLAAFSAAAAAAFFLVYQGHTPARLTMATLVTAIFITRLVKCLCRFLFSPNGTAPSVVSLERNDAVSLHKGVVRLTAFGSFAFLFGFLMYDLQYDQAAVSAYMFIIWTVFISMLVAGIWRERETVAKLIQGSYPERLLEGRVRRRISGSWQYPAIAFVLFVWLSAMFSALAGQQSVLAAALGTLLLFLLLPMMDAAIYKIVAEKLSPAAMATQSHEAETAAADEDDDEEIDIAEDDLDTTAVIGLPSFALATIRILRIVLVIVAALVLAGLWGVDVFTLSSAGIGQRITSAAVEISVAVLIAYVAWEFIKRLIDRRIDPGAGPAGPGDEGGSTTGASRIQTLLPLIRKFVLVTIVVVSVMLVLSSMGINIGPLIAGAGMIGLAVGFGAQTLVKDVISGMFFLMDDAFRVGEYIDIGAVKGTVERISVRSLQMRHHNGPVHTVPYGEIQFVTNYSRDWAIMKFELRIPFETDVDMVRRLIKKVGVAMIADEELGPLLLEPLKSQGVNRMDDSAFIVRCKFTSVPGQQFYLRREAYARIQAAFEAKGIKFAPKRVIVESSTSEGSAPVPPAIAAAAAADVATENIGPTAPADDRG